jgi:MFS family permease
LPLISAAALLALAGIGGPALVLVCLGAVGFAYGAIIAAYPAAIAKLFGPADSTRAYGRVFTAWGAAGLAAPWLAGVLFDRSGGYGAALGVAAGLGLVSAVAAAAGPRRRRPVSS